MQAPPGVVLPVAPAVATSSWPDILPGPFILLLLLPALPLLLFSIGARPPDTHSLPFSTDDLWQTTAFITVAGAVVLCVGLYPSLLGDVGTWVRGGGVDGWSNPLRYFTGDSPPTRLQSPGQSPGGVMYGQHQYQQQGHQQQYQQYPQAQYHPNNARHYVQQPEMRVRYETVPRTPDRVEYKPEAYRQDREGNVFHRPAARRVIPGQGGGKRMIIEAVQSQDPALDPLSHTSIGSRHLAVLRSSPFGPWYSAQKPSLAFGLLIGILVVFTLIIIVGRILGSAYDTETSQRKTSSSSKSENVEAWYIRELSKRKQETKEETIKRNKAQEDAFVGKLRNMDEEYRKKEVEKRKKELGMLKKELEKRKLPLVGLDWDFDKGKSRGASKKGEKDKKSRGHKKENKEVEGRGSGGKEPGRLKKMLLGPLASGPPKDTSLASKKTSKSESSTTMAALPKEGGPGWKPADDAVAHAAIMGGAVRAENLANDLVQQKRGG